MQWRDELIDQLDFYWQYSLWPRLEGLTDAEYFWEPVQGCWTIRRQSDDSYMIDWEWPTPDPPPVTTIAWRMAHIAVPVFGLRASGHFGDGSLTMSSAKWPASADSALTMLQTHYEWWRQGVLELDDSELLSPVGPVEGPWAERSFATSMLHINREVIHHGGEIALLRDLYRAGFTEAR